MEINIVTLVPKEWKIEELDNNSVKIKHISNGKGSHCRPIIIKKSIQVTEEFIAGIAMYLGDGKLAKDAHLAYASKDKDITLFMIKFFEEYINLNRGALSFALYYKTNSEIESWSEYLQVQSAKICTYKRDRVKYPVMILQIGSVILREIFGRVIDAALQLEIINNKKFRRAFLRGLFAAEGSIGVQRTEKARPYINSICYHFHLKETDLINYCCKCLTAEGIKYKVVQRAEKRGKATDIIITKWENYWKLWKAKVFDLCERKKKTFLEISKQAAFKCLLKEDFRYNLLNSTGLYQKDLAKELGTYQASISRIRQGKFLLSPEQLYILSELAKASIKEIKANTEYSKISANTFINDIEFLDFIYKVKLI